MFHFPRLQSERFREEKSLKILIFWAYGFFLCLPQPPTTFPLLQLTTIRQLLKHLIIGTQKVKPLNLYLWLVANVQQHFTRDQLMPHSPWYTGFSLNPSDSYTVTRCKQGVCYHGDPLGFLGVDPTSFFFFFFCQSIFFDVLDLAIQKARSDFLQQAAFKKYYHVVHSSQKILTLSLH